VAEYDIARLVNVVIEVMGPGRTAQELGEPPLALLKRGAAQVFAAKLEKIKGEQHRLCLGLAAVAQPIEYRNAIVPTDDDLAIDQTRQESAATAVAIDG